MQRSKGLLADIVDRLSGRRDVVMQGWILERERTVREREATIRALEAEVRLLQDRVREREARVVERETAAVIQASGLTATLVEQARLVAGLQRTVNALRAGATPR